MAKIERCQCLQPTRMPTIPINPDQKWVKWAGNSRVTHYPGRIGFIF
jgi:hypothetical protein